MKPYVFSVDVPSSFVFGGTGTMGESVPPQQRSGLGVLDATANNTGRRRPTSEEDTRKRRKIVSPAIASERR